MDVFFVVSGYLITGLLVRELEATGRIDFAQFYARRARRLLPAAALMLAATLVAGWFVFSPVEQRGLGFVAVATALYASNLRLARQATDYLAADADTNPLLHTWSLAVEEQFYLVWPLIVMAGTTGLARAGGRPDRARLARAVAALAAVSFAASVWLTRVRQPWAFFGSPTRAWEVAVGGLAALAVVPWDRIRPALVRALPWAGLALVAGAAVTFSATTRFPGAAALVPVLGTLALLVAGSRGEADGAHRLLHAPLLQWVGRLSYSWYLWHWPVLVYATAVGGELGLPARVAFALLSLALAAATLKLVENPVRLHPRLSARPARSMALAAALTLASVLGASGWLSAAEHASLAPGQAAFTHAVDEIPSVYPAGCHVDYFGTGVPDCAFAHRGAVTTVVLFGDSHAAQWFPALERVAQERGWRLVPLTKSACPAAAVVPYLPDLRRRYTECGRWRQAAVRRIVELRPAAVVMASASTYDGITPADWLAGTRAAAAAFDAAGLTTVLLRDTPHPRFDVPTCLARSAWNPLLYRDHCTYLRSDATDTVVFHSEVHTLDGLAHASVLDLTRRICDGESCPGSRGGVVLFRDGDHLAVRFSAALAAAVGRHLDRVGVH